MNKMEVWLNAAKQLQAHLESQAIQDIVNDVLEEEE